jgi:hypothetical protein
MSERSKEKEEEETSLLAEDLNQKLHLSDDSKTTTETEVSSSPPPHALKTTILCDMGYGFPKESRPRKEKLLAISRQLVNFLQWQTQSAETAEVAAIQVVACPGPEVAQALEARILQLWKSECKEDQLPSNFSISTKPLEDWLEDGNEEDRGQEPASLPVYLSPDAEDILDPLQDPPPIVVVGLVIDRSRIQLNRSADRATHLTLPLARWPLETVSDVLDVHEPLNVDCVLEGMQQWYWNCAAPTQSDSTSSSCLDNPQAGARRFQEAAVQALQHHQERHPNRPQHKQTAL